MAFAETLSDFFDSAQGFSVPAVYNGSATIQVILDKEYIEIEAGIGGVQSSAPMAHALSSDVPAATHGQTLVVASVTYKIVGVEPDGLGITVLRLEKQ